MSAVVETGLRTPAPRPHMPAVAAPDSFAHDVLDGLARPHKRIPSIWLYDLRGSTLFEQVTRLDAYYPARNEQALLQRALPHLAKACGRHAALLVIGGGAPRSTERLLAVLDAPAACLRLDVAPERWPAQPPQGGARLVFFPGPTLGHLAPRDAMAVFEQLGRATGRGTLLAVCADATQDAALLLPAYDDREGVSAAFNLNLLERINRELDGDFDLSDFEHQARWDAAQHCVEMHLVARRALNVQVLGRRFAFDAGESILTERCHKHTLLTFRALARHAGWAHRDFWMDSVSCYALHLLEYVD